MKQSTRRVFCIIKLIMPFVSAWPVGYAWVVLIPKFEGEWWNLPLGLDAFAFCVLNFLSFSSAIVYAVDDWKLSDQAYQSRH